MAAPSLPAIHVNIHAQAPSDNASARSHTLVAEHVALCTISAAALVGRVPCKPRVNPANICSGPTHGREVGKSWYSLVSIHGFIHEAGCEAPHCLAGEASIETMSNTSLLCIWVLDLYFIKMLLKTYYSCCFQYLDGHRRGIGNRTNEMVISKTYSSCCLLVLRRPLWRTKWLYQWNFLTGGSYWCAWLETCQSGVDKGYSWILESWWLKMAKMEHWYDS